MEDSNNHHNHYTAADIEKYHKGMLSPKERHALEKAALDDPFLADALEGYAVAGVNIKEDLDDLSRRLEAKTEETKVIAMYERGRSTIPWKKIAAVVILVLGAGFLSYQFLLNKKSDEVAQVTPGKNKAAKAGDSAAANPVINNNGDSTVTVASGLSGATTASSENPPLKMDVVQDAKQKSDSQPAAAGYEYFANTEKNNVPATPGLKQEKDNKPASSPAKDSISGKGDIARNDDVFARKRAVTDADKVANLNEKEAAFSPGIVGNKNVNQSYRNNLNYFKGRVTDANNNALPFANVVNVADNVGTFSDARGEFILVSPDSLLDVQVRNLGFQNNRVLLTSKAPSNRVLMQEDRSIAARVLDTIKHNYATVPSEGNLTFEEPEVGWETYGTYLANNMQVPEDFNIDKKADTKTNVVELSFEVNEFGDPVKIIVEKSLCDKCDKEAIRLLKEGPKWKHKAKKGKRTTVKVPFIKPGDM